MMNLIMTLVCLSSCSNQVSSSVDSEIQSTSGKDTGESRETSLGVSSSSLSLRESFSYSDEGYSYSAYFHDIAFQENQDGTCVAYGRYLDPAIKELTIPNVSLSGRKVTGVRGFDNLTRLEKVILPSSLLRIEEKAFFFDTQLKDVEIQEGLTEIRDYAFLDCRSLEEIHLPESLQSISEQAFERCHSLKSITIPKDVKVLPANVFDDCESLSEVYLPDGLTTIESFAFSYVPLEKLFIPKSVTQIEDRAFIVPVRKTLTLYVEAESHPSTWALKNDKRNIRFVYGAKRSDLNS